MEEYNLAWLEEPLGAWDPEGYANLRSKTTTRIAYGEREWTLDQFERVLATGTVDVIGVDPGRAEGITNFHLAFACFRFAVIFEGIARRAQIGTAAGADAEQVGRFLFLVQVQRGQDRAQPS